MKQKLIGNIIIILHILFIVCYVSYIIFAKITQNYINIVFGILISLVISSILFDGCFVTDLERYYLGDKEWKGLSYTAYKKLFGFYSDYEFLKYSFIFFLGLFYVTFIYRLKLHKNSLAYKYFDYLLKQ